MCVRAEAIQANGARSDGRRWDLRDRERPGGERRQGVVTDAQRVQKSELFRRERMRFAPANMMSRYSDITGWSITRDKFLLFEYPSSLNPDRTERGGEVSFHKVVLRFKSSHNVGNIAEKSYP